MSCGNSWPPKHSKMTMSLHRLRRFVAATLFLVLPLQGQAVASMSCHSVQEDRLVLGTQSPHSLQAHPAHHADVSAEGASADHTGHAHSHATPTDHPRDLDGVDSVSTAESGTNMQPSDSCVLCSTCCMLSTALPTHIASHSDLFKAPLPQLAPATMLVGFVPEGLLRPPR